MPRPNAGGGKYNQAISGPTRAIFSNFNAGKGDGKGKKGKDEKRGKRPNFESQKDLDKWKAAQKGSGGACTNAPAVGKSSPAATSDLWTKTVAPSYIHGVLCLTRDDHLAMEPLLNLCQSSDGGLQRNDGSREQLPSDLSEEAAEHLHSLGFLPARAKLALHVVGPQLLQEAEDRDTFVTFRAAAERALEWLCSVTEERDLPSKLRESRDVTNQRKRQEERNVICQTRSLLLGGELDSTHIARIEKLGFSRAKAIEALAQAPNHELVPAVKMLMSGYLPLEVDDDDAAAAQASSLEDLAMEVEAMQGAYGEASVHTFPHAGNFEMDAAVPESEWRLVCLIPKGLPYPLVAPLLCPRHPRLREAGRPRLLSALGQQCRSLLGGPMLFTLCEWLKEEGERFLVRGDAAEEEPLQKAGYRSHVSPQYHTLEKLEAQALQEEEAAKEKRSRVEFIKAELAKEEASKRKDKIALEIREDPASGYQYDLAGYDEKHVRELVREAFSMPLATEKMVRITFIIGGGKQVRQKYDESLGRNLATALQEIGFKQDSSAAADVESAGTFKGQHDTQRNLKLVHVFPTISGSVAVSGEESGRLAILPNETVEQAHKRLAAAAWDDFTEEVAPWTRTRDLRQKAEALLPYLMEAANELVEVDRLLKLGHKVDEARRRLYDELGGAEEVAEKVRWLSASLVAKPRLARQGCGGLTDGGTLDIDEGAMRLALASRLSKDGVGSALTDSIEESDDAWLIRRKQQTRTESDRLRAEFAKAKPLRETREALPAFSFRRDIQEAVQSSQVVIIEGETGCGKSTQTPQFILEDWVEKGWGGAANIIMTQPRRISAIGVAERIAAEMDTIIGEIVGYSIRLESKKSHRTKVLVCTTGVLLRRLETDGMLHGVTHIVVDECHERDLDTDFLLIFLRDLLPKRPGLKVILMSATINAQIFRDYFGQCNSIAIPGRTFPVTAYYLEHALEHTRFVVELNSQYAKRDAEQLSPHDEAEILQVYERDDYRVLTGGPVSRRVIEQMERMDPEKINFDLVAAVVRHIHTHLDPPDDQVGKRNPGAILVFVPGFGEIKKCIQAICDDIGNEKSYSSRTSGGSGGRWEYSSHGQSNDVDSGYSNRWSRGHKSEWVGDSWQSRGGSGKSWGKGSWDGSNGKSGVGVQDRGAGKGREAMGGECGGLWVLPLHSMISVADQRKVFLKPGPGLRKVVVTTNIAETSITIDDVEYVIDCGRHKQTKYDPQNRISMLVDCVETKANAKQRRGRAGRVKPGVCYHLMNVRKWRRLEEFEKPEMLRVPLDSLCLRISLLGLGHPARFLKKALTPPSEAAVRSSLQQLVELDAVELQMKKLVDGDDGLVPANETALGSEGWDKEEQDRIMKAKLRLTPLGTHLASLPVEAGMGKLLVLGCLFGIPREVCVLAAALSTKSPFQAGVGDKKKEVDKRKLGMAGNLESDHLLLVKLFDQWEALGKKSHEARSWCRTNCLDTQTFDMVAEMRTHLLGVLLEQGFVTRAQIEKRASEHSQGGQALRDHMQALPPCLGSIATAGEEFDRRKRQLLRALLCAALWPNVVLRKPDGQLFARNQASLAFHPSSVVGTQEATLKEQQAGDWNCPACTFFNFGSREYCLQCETARPAGKQQAAKSMRHCTFAYSEKTRTVASRPGEKSQTYVKDCCGVSLKAVALLGHRVVPDYLSGRASIDGWIHCQAAPRDVAMLLGLRRRLQEVLARMLRSGGGSMANRITHGEDLEVIDAVTSLLVLDDHL